MRITGGAARGITLKTPPGDATRPATDKLRLAVFSSLGDRVVGVRFADLFAGTGSYGLEAWSRGAASGVFVERHRPTAALLSENAAAVARSARVEPSAVRVVACDVVADWIQPEDQGSCELVFVDPPYAEITRLWEKVFALADRLLAPSETARVVFEVPANLHLPSPAGWEMTRRLDAGGGQPTATFWRRRPKDAK